MSSTPKSKVPLILGIISILVGGIIPIAGLIPGIIGLVQAVKGDKNTEHNYKIETILNIVGIVISVLSWIFNIIRLMG